MCYSRAALATAVAAAAAAAASHLARLHHFLLALHRGVVGSGNLLPTPSGSTEVGSSWLQWEDTDCLEESPKTVPIGAGCLRGRLFQLVGCSSALAAIQRPKSWKSSAPPSLWDHF